MKKKFIYPIIAIMSVISSCNSMLDITPISSMSVASFWKTSNDAKGALAGMYNEFRALGDDLFIMGESRSETMGVAGGRNADWRIKYFENTLSTQNADLGWQQIYKTIGTTNLIIANVPNINFSSNEEKNNIIAQAYTMRAFLYFSLLRTWGDVPLITEPISDISPEITFKERTSSSEIIKLIEDDLEKAISLYNNNSIPSCRCEWSKPSAYLVNGEIKLWKAKVANGNNTDLQEALASFEEVEKADVTLLDNFGQVFDYSNKGNKEILFSIHYNGIETTTNYYNEMYSLNTVIAISTNQTKSDLGPGGNIWWGPSQYATKQFHEDDSRAKSTFYPLYHGTSGEYLETSLIKYKGIIESNTRRFIDDIIIYRYAELLLLKAEVKNALNMDPSVEMNKIRKRAFGASFAEHQFENQSKIVNDELILKERLFELGWEGKRWWDLIRFGKAYNLVPSLVGRENNIPLLFPIDEGTLTRNSNLKQTPGYN